MASLSSDSAWQGFPVQGLPLHALSLRERPLARLAIEAELAGAAMACLYSSSDEYEAALIAERRRAGAYDVPSRERQILWAALAGCVVASIFLAF